MMASPLAFVLACRSPCSPPLSSAFSSSWRRIQELRPLRLPIAKNPGCLGFGNRFSRSGGRRKGGRGGAGWNAGRWEDAFELGGSVDLEAEIYEFMQRSASPNDFPTKDELIAAGRVDLVQAIATQGGWLAFGWDSGEEGRQEGSVKDAAGRQDSEKEIPQEDDRMSQHRFSSDSWGSGGSWKEDPMAVVDSEACSAASSSGRSIEMEGREEGGIEGILRRLERERTMSFALGSRERNETKRALWKKGDSDPRYAVGHGQCSQSKSPNQGINTSEEPTRHDRRTEDFGNDISQNGSSLTVDSKRSLGADMWRVWSLQRTGFPVSEFEAGEVVPSEVETETKHDSQCDVSTDAVIHDLALNGKGAPNKRDNAHSDLKQGSQNHIRMRLQHLESELSATLHSLRSGTTGTVSHEVQGSSLEELHRLSDAWEFQENEIMNARDRLRSIRAKLAVLEGKMALEIIEAQKVMEEKQKRLDAAQNAVCLLRSVCIVWPNPASEVLLVGSFDGWTTQRRMERSSTGIFSLDLTLYPGRYEIKFIVDGVWRTDPLRPMVNNNGHENNLLLISSAS